MSHAVHENIFKVCFLYIMEAGYCHLRVKFVCRNYDIASHNYDIVYRSYDLDNNSNYASGVHC